jgi:hypothetical protein
MRYLIFFIVLITFTLTVSAQEETLVTSDLESGGFGGPVLRYTSIYDQNTLLLGGRGGWIINHSIVIGAGGYGTVTEVDAPWGVLQIYDPMDLHFSYGGLELEYIFNPLAMGHFSVYLLVGGGSAFFARDLGHYNEDHDRIGDDDFIFVLEPAINGELNITEWFHVNAGLSYRFATDVELEQLKNSDFSGITGLLTLKFGSF